MKMETNVVYLCEMFPSVEVDVITDLVSSHPDKPLPELVDLCFSLGIADFKPAIPATDSDQAYEMISLVPPPSVGVDTDVPMPGPDLDSDAVTEAKLDPIDSFVSNVKRLRADEPPAAAIEAITVLLHCVNNLIKFPEEPKYRSLNLANEMFRKKLARLDSGVKALKCIGFQEVGEKLLISNVDSVLLDALKQILEKELIDAQMAFSSRDSPTTATKLDSKPKTKSKTPPRKVISREEMAAKHEARLRDIAAGKDPVLEASSASSSESRDSALVPGSAKYYESMKRIRKQIDDVRSEKHRKWRNTKHGRQRVITVSDLEARAHEEKMSKARLASAKPSSKGKTHTLDDFFDPDTIGKEALQYTNDFRKEQGLPPLEWSQALAEIGKVHSDNMGSGKVPFGHEGFDQRVRDYPFAHRGAGENVAMNKGTVQVARVSVDGWIDSPGHRRNLLGNWNFCGIGVVQASDGAWYLTQLFALV